MHLHQLYHLADRQPLFTPRQLAVYFPEIPIKSIRQNIYNWQQKGEVIQLRRGLYTLARSNVEPERVANLLYEPSYLSLEYALGYYQIVPDVSFAYTSISSCKTNRFENDLGVFTYRHVKPCLLFGYQMRSGVLFADKEKALLDFFYFRSSRLESDANYLEEMRLQNLDTLDQGIMTKYLNKFQNQSMFEFWSFCRDYYSF